MTSHAEAIIQHREQFIQDIDKQRRLWLYGSSVIFTLVVILGLTLPWLTNAWWWFISSILLIVGVNWWYWTMHIIHTVVKNQAEQVVLMKHLVSSIKEIKGL